MRTTIVSLAVIAAALLASPGASSAKDTTVTVFLPSGAPMNLATTQFLVTSKGGKIKMGKACLGNAGNINTWNMLAIDSSGGTRILTGASGDLKDTGVSLTSVRDEGTCTEGKATWAKYSAVLAPR